MNIIESSKNFEQISIFYDQELDFSAIISVHNSVLGPALGGCRLRHYDSMEAALEDVLRLSEGMTYKSSLAGLNLGGGKSVIIPSQKALDQREKLFLKFASWVDSLGGKYIAAEDMGTSVEDVKIMSRVTSHISGSDPAKGGGGDPSPHTAYGVYLGIGACLERVFGTPNYKDRKILIQGLGHVGFELAKLLANSGAKIIAAEPSKETLKRAKEVFDFETCSLDAVYSTECDVFAPCAMGGILDGETTKSLKSKIVAGAANNQLKTPDVEKILNERGIIYAPDFAINSGGVIMCAAELLEDGYSESWVTELVGRVGETIGRILDRANESGTLAGEVALEMAKERILEKSKQ